MSHRIGTIDSRVPRLGTLRTVDRIRGTGAITLTIARSRAMGAHLDADDLIDARAYDTAKRAMVADVLDAMREHGLRLAAVFAASIHGGHLIDEIEVTR